MPRKATGPSSRKWTPAVTLTRVSAGLCCLLLAAAALAQVRGPLSPGRRRPPRPPVQSTTVMILQGTLEQVDDVSLVLTTRDDRTVRVVYRKSTKFLLDDRPVTAASLKIGDNITVRARRTDEGVLLSESVMVQLNVPAAAASPPGRTSPAPRSPAARDDVPRDDEDAGPPTLRRRGAEDAAESAGRPAPPDLPADDDPAPPVLRRRKTAEPQRSAPPPSREPPALPEDDDPGPPRLRRKDSAEPSRAAAHPSENSGSPEYPPASAASVSAAQLDPLIEQARYEAFEYSDKLPNFVCREVMNRMERGGRRSGWRTIDILETDLVYEDGKESYSNIKINNRAVNKDMKQLDGSWSMGEFASTLLSIFVPASQTTFRFSRSSRAAGEPAVVYDFRIEEQNSQWNVTAGKGTIKPAYKGAIWIHEKTARVLRIETEAFNLPPDFELDTVEMTVDYGFVRIGGEEYLLPVASENLACWRGSNNCSRNKIEFRNYRKFGAESTIVTTDSEITFDGEEESPATKP